MKRVLVSLFLSCLFLVFASNNSYAEMSGRMGEMGKVMHEEGKYKTVGMKHHHRHHGCHHHHGGIGMRHEGHSIWMHLKGLGLDEKQREAIKDIESRHMKDTIRERADVQIAAIEMKDILDKEPVDMTAVEAKLKQSASLIMDMRLSRIKEMEEIKAQLTPEQRDKFKRNLRSHGRWGQCGGEKTLPSKKKVEKKHPAKETTQH